MIRLAHPARPHKPIEVAETNRQLLDYYLAEGYVEQLADAESGVEHQHPGYGEPTTGIEAQLGEEVEISIDGQSDDGQSDGAEGDDESDDEDGTSLDLG